MQTDKEFLSNIYKKYNNLDTSKDKFYLKNVNNVYNIKNYIIIFCTIIIFTSSILFADTLKIYFSHNDNTTHIYKGLNTALNNNFIQKIDMEYCKSNNVKIKISNISMDNSYIYLFFDIEFKKNLLDDINLFNFKNMVITDENNNIILCDDIKYREDNNISNNNILTSSSSRQFIEKTPANIKFLYILRSHNKFPKSKQLNINIEDILLPDINKDYTNPNDIPTINGQWKFKINLSEQFYNRESIIYNAKDNKYLKNINLQIDNTLSYLTFDLVEKVNIENIELLDNQFNTYNTLNTMYKSVDINDKNVKAYLELTKYDLTEDLMLHIKTDKFDIGIYLTPI